MAEIETLGLAIGAGVAALGVTGPAIGVSNVASKMLEGAARQPDQNVYSSSFNHGTIRIGVWNLNTKLSVPRSN